jgi:hypothetical protein
MLAAARLRSLGAAALVLLAAVVALPLASPHAAAQSQRRPLQIAGTWDATWRNSSGAPRRGLIVVEQSGARISARIESHGNVTATGTIAGSTFTLYGSRLGVPFTITGRVSGRRMAGTLASLLLERRFTATRRRGR